MSQRVTPIPAIYRHDPDEMEEGLYRARAAVEARSQLAYEKRRVRLALRKSEGRG
jgi:hypothetical protein